MSDIPADIMAVAEAVAGNLPPDMPAEPIARAILAERERCAKVADEHANRYRRAAAWGDFAPPCEGIAAAIRKGAA